MIANIERRERAAELIAEGILRLLGEEGRDAGEKATTPTDPEPGLHLVGGTDTDEVVR